MEFTCSEHDAVCELRFSQEDEAALRSIYDSRIPSVYSLYAAVPHLLLPRWEGSRFVQELPAQLQPLSLLPEDLENRQEVRDYQLNICWAAKELLEVYRAMYRYGIYGVLSIGQMFFQQHTDGTKQLFLGFQKGLTCRALGHPMPKAYCEQLRCTLDALFSIQETENSGYIFPSLCPELDLLLAPAQTDCLTMEEQPAFERLLREYEQAVTAQERYTERDLQITTLHVIVVSLWRNCNAISAALDELRRIHRLYPGALKVDYQYIFEQDGIQSVSKASPCYFPERYEARSPENMALVLRAVNFFLNQSLSAPQAGHRFLVVFDYTGFPNIMVPQLSSGLWRHASNEFIQGYMDKLHPHVRTLFFCPTEAVFRHPLYRSHRDQPINDIRGLQQALNRYMTPAGWPQ